MTDDTSDNENNTFIEDKQAFTQTVAPLTTTFPRFKLLLDDTFFSIQITEFAYNDSTVINNSGAAGSFSSLPLSPSFSLLPTFSGPARTTPSLDVALFCPGVFACSSPGAALSASARSELPLAVTTCRRLRTAKACMSGLRRGRRRPVADGSFSRCDNSGRQSRPRPPPPSHH